MEVFHDTDTECHLPYGITYYPTQVNTPRLNPSHAGRYSIYLPRMDERLSWPSWLDSTPAGNRTSDFSTTSPTLNHCTTKTTSNYACLLSLYIFIYLAFRIQVFMLYSVFIIQTCVMFILLILVLKSYTKYKHKKRNMKKTNKMWNKNHTSQ